ncbi:MAG: hypothetical protein JKY31_05410 [Rhodobacteraceae bacterium]|nr:hypothetical protein [Paracoccaceae bacterium]
MIKFLRRLVKDDNGAVTVDWVVLTAVVVLLGVAVLSVIGPSLTDTASEISVVIETGLT